MSYATATNPVGHLPTLTVATMKRYVILRQSYRHSHRKIRYIAMMDSDTLSNITVQYYDCGHPEAVISIDSAAVFTVFSLTITLVAHAELNIMFTDSGKSTDYPMSLRDRKQLCFEKDLTSFPQKAFYCPMYTSPKSSHHLVVWGLEEEIPKTVSTKFSIVL